MAERARWEERYREGDWVDTDEPSTIVHDALAWLEPPGLVLDIACGAGRNALFLARCGFSVIAIDISWEGLMRLSKRARAENLAIFPVHADLQRFTLPDAAFDIIVNTRFLLRPLFPDFQTALKPGGLLLLETFNRDEIDVLGGDMRPDYTLEQGELLRAFPELEFLLVEEGVFQRREGERGLGRLIARRPHTEQRISNIE